MAVSLLSNVMSGKLAEAGVTTGEAWTRFTFLLCPTQTFTLSSIHVHAQTLQKRASTYTSMHMHFQLVYPGVVCWNQLPHLWETPLYELVRQTKFQMVEATRMTCALLWGSILKENLFREQLSGDGYTAITADKSTERLPALHFLDAVLFYSSHSVTFKIRTPIMAHRKSANVILIWIADTAGLAVIRAPFESHQSVLKRKPECFGPP